MTIISYTIAYRIAYILLLHMDTRNTESYRDIFSWVPIYDTQHLKEIKLWTGFLTQQKNT